MYLPRDLVTKTTTRTTILHLLRDPVTKKDIAKNAIEGLAITRLNITLLMGGHASGLEVRGDGRGGVVFPVLVSPSIPNHDHSLLRSFLYEHATGPSGKCSVLIRESLVS